MLHKPYADNCEISNSSLSEGDQPNDIKHC